MEVDEEVRREAVSAVLDRGLTQKAACSQYGLKPYELRVWIADERRHRQAQHQHQELLAESVKIRLHRLEANAADKTGIGRGLRKEQRTAFWLRHVIGWIVVVCGFLVILAVLGVAFLLILNQFYAAQLWTPASGVIALSAFAIVWLTAVVADYFGEFIYRACAPFAYAATYMRHALHLLETSGAEIFDAGAGTKSKSVRNEVREALTRAAHVLDVTRRLGRKHSGNHQTKKAELKARRNVSAAVAGAEDMMYHEGFHGKGPAMQIIRLALYETVLRKWTLQDPSHPADEMRPSMWKRRIQPFLKTVGAFAFALAPIALEIVGPEGVTPGKFIRQLLQSHGFIP